MLYTRWAFLKTTTIEELYAWQFSGPFLDDFLGHRPPPAATPVPSGMSEQTEADVLSGKCLVQQKPSALHVELVNLDGVCSIRRKWARCLGKIVALSLVWE